MGKKVYRGVEFSDGSYRVLEIEGVMATRVVSVEEVMTLLNRAEEDRESYHSEIAAMRVYHEEMKKLIETLMEEKRIVHQGSGGTEVPTLG